MTMTVIPSGMSATSVTVGQNLQMATHVTLNSPVPGDPNDIFAPKLPMTITSNDPSKLLFSAKSLNAG